MKATEFAEFFDLTIGLMTEENAKEYEHYEDYYPSKYIVWDNMGYYTPWFIDNVSDLTWCVDSMADNYIIDDLCDEYGFKPEEYGVVCLADLTLYEKAAEFATERNINYADVVRAVAGYEEIEDDVA